MKGNEASYEPISLVEFEGSISSTGQSQGHYICDIRECLSKLWFRANDNNYPTPIRPKDVSKNAYVILLKRCDD